MKGERVLVQQAFVKKNVYQDSVKLMRITEQIKELPGVMKAAAIMGTENNKATTIRGGFTFPSKTKWI